MGRWKLPPDRDFGFYQRRKHDKWREVPAPMPALEAPVADSHTHVHMLPDSSWELARCAANGVDLVCDVADPADDDMDRVFALVSADTTAKVRECLKVGLTEDEGLVPERSADAGHASTATAEADSSAPAAIADVDDACEFAQVALAEPPRVLFAIGVHPHNAEAYDDTLERQLREHLARPEVVVLGEIGLDYYYDNSPREAQREVFRRQIRLAKELALPIALHLRSGEGPNANAHEEAFEILSEEGFPKEGTLLHCCSLDSDQLKPWVDVDCYIAYGGALTFKDADSAREGACIVPVDRLLLETDAPYMTPEPMRGATCTPAHVIYTAERLADVRNASVGIEREALLHQIHENTCRFLGVS